MKSLMVCRCDARMRMEHTDQAGSRICQPERILWNVVQTHLVHITGPLHDVLEGAFTGDVVHQEDSLDGRREEDKQKRTFSVVLIREKASISICF